MNQYATANSEDVITLRDWFDKGHSVSKDQATSHFGIPDRRFRAAIARLRHEGYPVVSWSDEDSVYRKAHDVAEVHRFVDTEISPRIQKLEHIARQMRTNGPSHYRVHQPALI